MESRLAHKYLDGLIGIEIGGASHNAFNIPGCKNVDYTDDYNTIFKQEEMRIMGYPMKIDIVSNGDDLPFKDNELDYVVSSHVIEHFKNPLVALREWYRVIKPGGYIFTICPHKDRTFDYLKPRTTLKELIERENNPDVVPDIHDHYTIWITEDMIEAVNYLGYKIVAVQDSDDKVGNGFTVVIQKA